MGDDHQMRDETPDSEIAFQALARLDYFDRTLFWMEASEELTREEMAAELRMTEPNFARAMQIMKMRLGRAADDVEAGRPESVEDKAARMLRSLAWQFRLKRRGIIP